MTHDPVPLAISIRNLPRMMDTSRINTSPPKQRMIASSRRLSEGVGMTGYIGDGAMENFVRPGPTPLTKSSHGVAPR